jgi:hypothetical protein
MSNKEEKLKKEIEKELQDIEKNMVSKLIKYLATGIIDFVISDYTTAYK